MIHTKSPATGFIPRGRVFFIFLVLDPFFIL